MSSETESPSAGKRVSRFALRYWFAIIVTVLAVVFIAQNRQSAPVHILWIQPSPPMWILLTVIFVAGILVGLLLGRRRRNRA